MEITARNSGLLAFAVVLCALVSVPEGCLGSKSPADDLPPSLLPAISLNSRYACYQPCLCASSRAYRLAGYPHLLGVKTRSFDDVPLPPVVAAMRPPAEAQALAGGDAEMGGEDPPMILPDSLASIAVSFADGRPPLTVKLWRRLGTPYLADSDVSAAFGISLKWDPVLRLMAMRGRRGEATAVVGGTAAIVGDRVLNLPHPFLREAGRILVPVSFLVLELPSISNVSLVLDSELGELLASAAEPTVSGVTLGGRPGLARVTVATKRALAYRVIEGRDELRLVLMGAVADTTFAVKGASMSPLRDCVADWRGEELTLRFPLARSARALQTFREDYPQAIVLVVSTAQYREGYDLEPLSRVLRGEVRGRTVVLDPAHGGDEQGAVAEGGVAEKDVALAICKKAASILRRRLGINVHLTRDADHRVPQAGRAELANARDAALFVSVHCDSWPGSERRGYGAFVSPEPAIEGGYRTPQAERSASPAATEDGPAVLLKPWHKAQGRYAAESQRLASAIVGEMARVHDGPVLGIRRVKLASLAGVDAPAVAVRCGFLSNEDDLKLLGGSEGRDRLAAALARGIEVYLDNR